MNLFSRCAICGQSVIDDIYPIFGLCVECSAELETMLAEGSR